MTEHVDPSESARTREPLPEELAVETGGEDRESETAAILAESEERVADATAADAPGDAADEHRRSEDTTLA